MTWIMTGYYDHVLGLIPASLIGSTAVLSVYGVSFSAAVFVGALLSLGFMLHALFVAAPTAAGNAATRITVEETTADIERSLEHESTSGRSRSAQIGAD